MANSKDFGELADEQTIEKTKAALKANGLEAWVVNSGEEAKAKIMELLPPGAEVMSMTSMTLEALGIAKEINTAGKYASVRSKLTSMSKDSQGSEMRKLGAAPDWTVGSVHALTEDGHAVIASMTGSQLPAYAYGAGKVIWVVGAQKIVQDVAEGLQRINDYVFPLEDARAMKAYGVHSGVNKLLIVNKEVQPGRITVIIVKEKLGF